MSLFNLNGLAQFGEPARLTAGDEHLTGDNLIENKVLPSLIQFRQNIIQQQHRFFTPFPGHQFPLGQLQRDGGGAGLTLGAVGFQIDARKGDGEIILMGARQTF